MRIPCIPPEAGAETHTALVLTHELAIFKALNVRGLGMWRERLVVMNECETFVGNQRKSYIGIIPSIVKVLIFIRDTRKS